MNSDDELELSQEIIHRIHSVNLSILSRIRDELLTGQKESFKGSINNVLIDNEKIMAIRGIEYCKPIELSVMDYVKSMLNVVDCNKAYVIKPAVNVQLFSEKKLQKTSISSPTPQELKANDRQPICQNLSCNKPAAHYIKGRKDIRVCSVECKKEFLAHEKKVIDEKNKGNDESKVMNRARLLFLILLAVLAAIGLVFGLADLSSLNAYKITPTEISYVIGTILILASLLILGFVEIALKCRHWEFGNIHDVLIGVCYLFFQGGIYIFTLSPNLDENNVSKVGYAYIQAVSLVLGAICALIYLRYRVNVGSWKPTVIPSIVLISTLYISSWISFVVWDDVYGMITILLLVAPVIASFTQFSILVIFTYIISGLTCFFVSIFAVENTVMGIFLYILLLHAIFIHIYIFPSKKDISSVDPIYHKAISTFMLIGIFVIYLISREQENRINYKFSFLGETLSDISPANIHFIWSFFYFPAVLRNFVPHFPLFISITLLFIIKRSLSIWLIGFVFGFLCILIIPKVSKCKSSSNICTPNSDSGKSNEEKNVIITDDENIKNNKEKISLLLFFYEKPIFTFYQTCTSVSNVGWKTFFTLDFSLFWILSNLFFWIQWILLSHDEEMNLSTIILVLCAILIMSFCYDWRTRVAALGYSAKLKDHPIILSSGVFLCAALGLSGFALGDYDPIYMFVLQIILPIYLFFLGIMPQVFSYFWKQQAVISDHVENHFNEKDNEVNANVQAAYSFFSKFFIHACWPSYFIFLFVWFMLKTYSINQEKNIYYSPITPFIAIWSYIDLDVVILIFIAYICSSSWMESIALKSIKDASRLPEYHPSDASLYAPSVNNKALGDKKNDISMVTIDNDNKKEMKENNDQKFEVVIVDDALEEVDLPPKVDFTIPFPRISSLLRPGFLFAVIWLLFLTIFAFINVLNNIDDDNNEAPFLIPAGVIIMIGSIEVVYLWLITRHPISDLIHVSLVTCYPVLLFLSLALTRTGFGIIPILFYLFTLFLTVYSQHIQRIAQAIYWFLLSTIHMFFFCFILLYILNSEFAFFRDEPTSPFAFFLLISGLSLFISYVLSKKEFFYGQLVFASLMCLTGVYLTTTWTNGWLPFIAFVLVLIALILVVRNPYLPLILFPFIFQSLVVAIWYTLVKDDDYTLVIDDDPFSLFNCFQLSFLVISFISLVLFICCGGKLWAWKDVVVAFLRCENIDTNPEGQEPPSISSVKQEEEKKETNSRYILIPADIYFILMIISGLVTARFMYSIWIYFIVFCLFIRTFQERILHLFFLAIALLAIPNFYSGIPYIVASILQFLVIAIFAYFFIDFWGQSPFSFPIYRSKNENSNERNDKCGDINEKITKNIDWYFGDFTGLIQSSLVFFIYFTIGMGVLYVWILPYLFGTYALCIFIYLCFHYPKSSKFPAYLTHGYIISFTMLFIAIFFELILTLDTSTNSLRFWLIFCYCVAFFFVALFSRSSPGLLYVSGFFLFVSLLLAFEFMDEENIWNLSLWNSFSTTCLCVSVLFFLICVLMNRWTSKSLLAYKFVETSIDEQKTWITSFIATSYVLGLFGGVSSNYIVPFIFLFIGVIYTRIQMHSIWILVLTPLVSVLNALLMVEAFKMDTDITLLLGIGLLSISLLMILIIVIVPDIKTFWTSSHTQLKIALFIFFIYFNVGSGILHLVALAWVHLLFWSFCFYLGYYYSNGTLRMWSIVLIVAAVVFGSIVEPPTEVLRLLLLIIGSVVVLITIIAEIYISKMLAACNCLNWSEAKEKYPTPISKQSVKAKPSAPPEVESKVSEPAEVKSKLSGPAEVSPTI